ncbi:MAG: GMC family oxidoreductase [Bradymonadia bacterium]
MHVVRAHPVISAFIALLGLTGCGETTSPEDNNAPSTEQQCTGGKCDGDETSQVEFDYIVVGSGAGGGPLASNLARAGYEVLLLEAGDDFGGKLQYQIPAWQGVATEDPDLSLAYFVEHYADPDQAARDTKRVDGKGVLYPRGGTLGGSTAVNAMITVYPHDSDWQYISELMGDDSWAPEKMRQYFQRVERNGYLNTSEEEGHGLNGWLNTEAFSPTAALWDGKFRRIGAAAAFEFVDSEDDGFLLDAFRNVRELIGLLTRDINEMSPDRDEKEGLFNVPKATRFGRRNGTRERILDTAERFPLTVRTNSLVTRVLFGDTPDANGQWQATGVEYLAGHKLYRAHHNPSEAVAQRVEVKARKEVILSAGAFNTPQLLMLSGIGPKDELQRHGIDTRIDLPGVGRNLQDRYEVGIVFEADDDFELLDDCTFDPEDDPCVVDWQRTTARAEEKGQRDQTKDLSDASYTSHGVAFAVIKKSSTAESLENDPDLFIFGAPGDFRGYYPGWSSDATARKDLFTWVILKGHTENRGGVIKLRSADPLDTPDINFHYFEEGDLGTLRIRDAEGVISDHVPPSDDDLTAVVDAIELVRKIGRKTDKLSLIHDFDEIWPGPQMRDREALGQFVKDESWGHHASCSAKMGPDSDPFAVLDSRFRVRGANGLRVVDASVFPRIPGFFIVTPIYMVSEKASDVILEDANP